MDNETKTWRLLARRKSLLSHFTHLPWSKTWPRPRAWETIQCIAKAKRLSAFVATIQAGSSFSSELVSLYQTTAPTHPWLSDGTAPRARRLLSGYPVTRKTQFTQRRWQGQRADCRNRLPPSSVRTSAINHVLANNLLCPEDDQMVIIVGNVALGKDPHQILHRIHLRDAQLQSWVAKCKVSSLRYPPPQDMLSLLLAIRTVGFTSCTGDPEPSALRHFSCRTQYLYCVRRIWTLTVCHPIVLGAGRRSIEDGGAKRSATAVIPGLFEPLVQSAIT